MGGAVRLSGRDSRAALDGGQTADSWIVGSGQLEGAWRFFSPSGVAVKTAHSGTGQAAAQALSSSNALEHHQQSPQRHELIGGRQ